LAKRRPTPVTPKLPLAVGRKLVAVAAELIEQLYVHLPLKRSMYAVNPLQRLRLLDRRLATRDAAALTDRQFYDEMLSIFNQLRDLHTTFVLPEPFRSSTALLPFRLEAYFERGQRRYVVSALIGRQKQPPGFKRGTIVTHWNGVPIGLAVAANAEREAGSNADARHARGLKRMTIRWLGQSLLPDEEWVNVTYRPSSRARTTRTAQFKWRVLEQRSTREHKIARAQGKNCWLIGMDAAAEVERQVRAHVFGQPTRRAISDKRVRDVKTVKSTAVDVFPSCRDIQTRFGTFAYVRITTFNVSDDTAFLNEFMRIIGRLSQDGLILDVRGNGGGLIAASERLLQLLTPHPIEGSRYHFINSTRTERLARRFDDLKSWHPSIAQSVETGDEFSQGLPLFEPALYNDIGQRYQGPVVLVTDGLCYSATDIFAAGFQDHGIGMILGVDGNTGAGGANVWEYSDVASLIGDRRALPLRLPRQASFRVAVRRVTRVGANAGLPLEDLGVRPTRRHYFTRDDVLKQNVDLIAHAAELLSTMPRHRLVATRTSPTEFRIDTSNLDCVRVFLDDDPLSTTRRPRAGFTLTLPRKPDATELRLKGFRRGKLVAATRVPLSV
jgi:C-terminal processing protease CtpA/Prc